MSIELVFAIVYLLLGVGAWNSGRARDFLERLLFQILATYCWAWVITMLYWTIELVPMLAFFLVGYLLLNTLTLVIRQRHRLRMLFKKETSNEDTT